VTLDVRPTDGPDEVRAAFALRHDVFVLEQGVPTEEELDEHDETALHLVAVDDGIVVGTCRLLDEGEGITRLGRMAVARSARRRGVAAALLREADEQARAVGARRMMLSAQTAAEPVYARAGYVPRGPRFIEAGIEHVEMEKDIA
jgi:predicted GNAT family N-acyltransferase